MIDPAVKPMGDGTRCNAAAVVSRPSVLMKYGARLDTCCAGKSVSFFLNVYKEQEVVEVKIQLDGPRTVAPGPGNVFPRQFSGD